jgi:conjugal transfer pilus assembly protein TraF
MILDFKKQKHKGLSVLRRLMFLRKRKRMYDSYRLTQFSYLKEDFLKKEETMDFLERVKRKEAKKAILPRMNNFRWSFPLYKIVKCAQIKNIIWSLFLGNFSKRGKVLFLKRKMQKGPIGKAQQHFGVYNTKFRIACFFLCVLNFFIFCQVLAKDSFYKDMQRGYFWFETPSVFDPSAKETPTLKAEPAWSDPRFKTAREALKAFKEELEEKKAHFVMKPTTDSALSYLKIQKAMLNQTSHAATAYEKARILTEKSHSTSSYVVNRIKDKERDSLKKRKIALSARLFDLLFVYKKSCPYCEKFKDVLVRFKNSSGYHVDALSLDGGKYKDFHPINTHPIEKITNFDMLPALFLVSKAKDIAVPITQGYQSYDLLKDTLVFILDELEKQK